jgi:hypothetical protein
MFWVAYLLLCVLAGYLGKGSRLGFWGVALVALLATPLVALLFVVLFGRPDRPGSPDAQRR